MEESNARRIVNEMREDILGPQLAAGLEGKQVAEELENLNPNIEMDAKEFGEHVRNGGWRLGLLVARSVEPKAGQGSRTDLELSGNLPKVSPFAFARQAGNISNKTVSKYLIAWNLAAADGLVPDSQELSPGQSFTFDAEEHTPEAWKKYFKTPGDVNEKNAFISLNDGVSAAITKFGKWDEAIQEYDDQREVSLDDFVENLKSLERIIRTLKANAEREATTKKYVNSTQE